jgi:transposase
MNRWSKAGVLDRVFARLQQEQIIAIKFEAVSLDSTTVKVHPDDTGALKNGAASHRPFPRGLHHQDSSGCRACSVRPEFFAFPGPGGGCATGTGIVTRWRPGSQRLSSDHGRACESDETRDLALKLGYILVGPPKTNRLCPWEYDRLMYRRRNEFERLFRRLKGFRRVFSRFDKLDVMFAAFVLFALIVDALRFSVNTP